MANRMKTGLYDFETRKDEKGDIIKENIKIKQETVVSKHYIKVILRIVMQNEHCATHMAHIQGRKLIGDQPLHVGLGSENKHEWYTS